MHNLKLVRNSMQLLEFASAFPLALWILNLIDARSIPIIGARFPSPRSVLEVYSALNARNTRSFNVPNARSHGCACQRTTIIVLSSLPIVGSKDYG